MPGSRSDRAGPMPRYWCRQARGLPRPPAAWQPTPTAQAFMFPL